jgi:hypothetical protein
MKKLTYLLATIAVAGWLCGCKTVLDPAGVYQGDTYLYQIDKTISLQEKALTVFVTWEMDNRPAILAQWPQVTVVADMVRVEAPKWFAATKVARDGYITIRDLYKGTGFAAISNSVDVAKLTLTSQVNDVGNKVSAAQAQINSTTIPNKPKL